MSVLYQASDVALLQVLPLHILIGSLQSTLIDIAKVEEQESSILRQKYLLHFLYKYISRLAGRILKVVVTRISVHAVSWFVHRACAVP